MNGWDKNETVEVCAERSPKPGPANFSVLAKT